MLALWWQVCTTGMKVQIREMFPLQQGRAHRQVKGLQWSVQSRVYSVTEELPDEQDDHFMVYSTHTVCALKSSGIRVPVCIEGTIRASVCIEGTTFDMQLDTAADVSLLSESPYRKHLRHLPLQRV